MAQRDIAPFCEQIRTIERNVCEVFIGKQRQVRHMLIGFIAGLHVLIEDVPGVGKTTLARCLAASTGIDYGRIQFTPDLLPGDIVGMTVWNNENRQFEFKQGAIMHQFILADEINRASPRTQSSLLEAMQEGSVTVDGTTYRLPEPFFVIATQNPVTFIGVFHLPEGELDRFGISLSIGYPHVDDEIRILDQYALDPLQAMQPVVQPDDVIELRRVVRSVTVATEVRRYIVALAQQTRDSSLLRLGVSPRAAQHIMLAAQGEALITGRDYVMPEDVMAIAGIVLTHRVVLSAEARMENLTPAQVVERILQQVPIPTGLS
jgi:MoxR-like ATPase